MEPTLCFRLCDTPIIYLQKTICRCSGAGLMHSSRQLDTLCHIPCTKPVDRTVLSVNTCGGTSTYSAYVQEKFYSHHGHLFSYGIEFAACELWNSFDLYETQEVKFNENIERSSLNKLERCAASCLDSNATVRSLAFNADNERCLCIIRKKNTIYIDPAHSLTVLANTSCDRYCNNTYEGSKTDLKFQCGSLNNSQIYARYDLNGSCPTNFAFIKEIQKCVYEYRNFWNTCTPPSVSFVYDGSFKWNIFLTIIQKLHLNDSIVTVDFDPSLVIDSSWKCPDALSTSSSSSSSLSRPIWSSYYSHSRSTLYGWSSSTRYVLINGCLQERSQSSYAHRYSHRLCMTNAVDRYSSSDTEATNGTYVAAINPQVKFCPTNWFDLNGRCYRMSDERKTIEQAKKTCIKPSPSTPSKANNKSRIWVINDLDRFFEEEDELNDSPTGEIVEYVSEWQARLGFFLLDTDPDSDYVETDGIPSTTTLGTLFYDDFLVSDTNDTIIDDHQASINEFQVIEANEYGNSSANDSTCVLVTRSVAEEEERPTLRNQLMKNCSQRRHVLCESNTLVVENFQYACLSKPKVLGLPALISSYLTHELCLSVCQELQTKLAILHRNKCYCLNGARGNVFNITTQFAKHRQKNCGDPCPGNAHEICGNEETIVAFEILDSRRTFTYARTPAEPFPNYIYQNCVRFNSYNQSTIYNFTLELVDDLQPSYCLALCTKYEQKYALINNMQCLCTNQAMKEDQDDVNILRERDCLQQCQANYFYSCGNQEDSDVYSMYQLQPKCRHGFEVAENDQQCVYSHFSSKRSSLTSAQDYCQSIGGILAKINDPVEIQDILPDSILHTRLMQQLLVFYKFKFINDTRYFWIDRTSTLPDPNSISERLLKLCSQVPDVTDANCIAIQYVPNPENSSISHERCIVQSNECATQSAMPVCVDQHLTPKETLLPPITDDNPSPTSVNITADHRCNDENYHLVDDFCYRVSLHEKTWNDAKAECQLDQAQVFVPEKSVTLQYIKSLYLRQISYTSSGIAHVGVYYDLANKTVVQFDETNSSGIVPDSNAVYALCEKTFLERYTALMSSARLTNNEKNLIKRQQMGCAYIDLITNTVPTIRCDELPCNRTAVVICQKSPTTETKTIKAKREDVEVTSNDQASTIGPGIQSELDSMGNTRSVGRDFAPMFLILASFFILILLAILSTLYRRRYSFRQSRRTSTYSQLRSANEFDLN